MYLFIFALSLILHIVICKKICKSILTPFGIYGLIWFGLLILIQLPIIRYYKLSVETVLIIYMAYIAFMLPNLLNTKNKYIRIINETKKVNVLCLKKINAVAVIVYAFLVALVWIYFIRYFGGLKYIFSHAYDVRHSAMGVQIYPLIISYGLSIGYVASGISSFLLFFSKERMRVKKILYFLPLVCAIINDLITFSRMGMVMHIIIYLGTYCIYFMNLSAKSKKRQIKYILIGGILICMVLIVPKLFRNAGGLDNEEYLQYSGLKSRNLLTESFLHFYTYISGPIVAFDNYIINFDGNYTLGIASLLPIFNFLNRLIPSLHIEYNLVYKMVSVPIETNIFTYLREAYSDFGILGIFLIPGVLGAICWLCCNIRFKNPYLKIVLLQYVFLYVVFGIFYTPYSQGSPTIGFVLYFMVILFSNKKLCYNDKAILLPAERGGC